MTASSSAPEAPSPSQPTAAAGRQHVVARVTALQAVAAQPGDVRYGVASTWFAQFLEEHRTPSSPYEAADTRCVWVSEAVQVILAEEYGAPAAPVKAVFVSSEELELVPSFTFCDVFTKENAPATCRLESLSASLDIGSLIKRALDQAQLSSTMEDDARLWIRTSSTEAWRLADVVDAPPASSPGSGDGQAAPETEDLPEELDAAPLLILRQVLGSNAKGAFEVFLDVRQDGDSPWVLNLSSAGSATTTQIGVARQRSMSFSEANPEVGQVCDAQKASGQWLEARVIGVDTNSIKVRPHTDEEDLTS